MEEVEDARNGVTFLQQQSQVDPDRIGIVGTSWGGPIAIYTSAIDERIKCTTVNVPVGNGRKWLRSLRHNWEWQLFMEEVEEDRARRVLTGTSKMVDRQHILIPDPEGKAFNEEKLKKNPDTCTQLPLETAEALIEFMPDEVIHKIAPRPILFTIAGKDVITPIEITRELYERAGEPKKFVVIPGCTHYATYSQPYLQTILDEVSAWFEKFMPPGR